MNAGISDPGRESGYFAALELMQQGVESTENPNAPFDAHRRLTAEGREYWSARDLQPLLDYTAWRKFTDAITRAKASGRNAGHDMSRHIVGAAKMVDIGSGAQRSVEDHHLSPLACYLIAMNGDPLRRPWPTRRPTSPSAHARPRSPHQPPHSPKTRSCTRRSPSPRAASMS